MTNDNTIAIFIGVISGILTALLSMCFKNTFYKIILPWYLDKTYNGVDVSGNWVGESIISGSSYKVAITLTQRAHTISGIYSASSDDPNSRRHVTQMSCEGELWEGYITIACRSIDKKDLSFGSMLLKVKGKELSGKQIFRDLSSSHNDAFSSNIAFRFEK